ncbi:hypothetical protein WI41_27035 [Burkholderia latens]|uniref:Uncharacterized protein n=1 Tax=Burkholderia latens TaxID=488446 RepID=A0AAP1G5M7_9BURK|nr:hypothetical protein [Burkholderia latens]AIO39538.1 putative membrane protein [Burkholderia cenocepacia]KUZ98966.1 hypothetical protein WI41_27035 [Burkholderia latens]MBY4696788.1 hypothetical protein [Burkholderia latens]QTO45254.1 hypothetical protein J8I85_22650 [Burkholderia latens]QTO50167.1 hypothetical protein J8I86_21700 [Burkholderia latens]
MTLLKPLFEKWKAQSPSGKLYTSGNAALTLVMGALVAIPWTAQRTLTLVMAVPLVLFMAGFLIWFVPKLLAFSRSQIGTMPIVVVSTLLAPICLGVSRQFVGMVVRLPPQSFDVTVALFAVLFIPIGWGVVVSAILLFVCSVSILGVMTTSSFRPFLRIFAVNPTGWLACTLGRVAAAERAIGNHAAGAFVFGIVILLLSAGYASAVANPAVGRLAAYALDFSYADEYPGIRSGERIRLLDNGLVAHAERRGLEVTFDVNEYASRPKAK